MDTARFLLAIALTLLVLWLYQMWMESQYPEYFSERAPVEQKQPSSKGGSPAPSGESAGGAKGTRTPEDGGGQEVPEIRGEGGEKEKPAERGASPSRPGLTVTTDVLRVTFGKQSGDPLLAELLSYQRDAEEGSPPVRILTPEGPREVVAQAGWLGQGVPSPSHKGEFRPIRDSDAELGEGQQRMAITFVHRTEGLEFRKTYRFRRGSYRVGLEYTVINRGSEPWQGYIYGQLRERGSKPGAFFFGNFSFEGPVLFAGESMWTLGHEELLERKGQEIQKRDPDGWSGVMSRYFLSVWLPDPNRDSLLFARATERDSFAGFTSPFPRVEPGNRASLTQDLFLGPKEQSLLESMGRHLRRAVDYGILSFLAIPLFKVLQFFHSLVGNYGFAIILVVVVIKVLFYPLFTMSYRAMAKMRKVQPELQRLREEYSDDRQRLNQEMMRLYREEKVNPLGGCLPILVQIPVFIALYWVLLESVELRHEPFILWIRDLTSQDPFYILPVLMGASMVVQQLMNPAPLDPVQKKVMLALPVVFTVFFMQFPAGLVLYWLTNNLLSIAQQWWIMRRIE